MRIALGLEYDGSRFSGWQSQAGQPNRRTIQTELERAISFVADATTEVVTAGRTDTGVHATGQVVHFDTIAIRPLTAWTRGVNAELTDSIRVQWATPVVDEFHARFSATTRTYRYWLLTAPNSSATLAHRVGWFHQSLQLAAMRDAAQSLVGKHDFSSFRAAGCQAKSPVRELSVLNVTEHPIGDGRQLFCFELTANAFLYHMVRNIVGCLVYIGAERESVAWAAELLATKLRTKANPTFMPDGLYLAHVHYDERFQLPNSLSPPYLVG
jgi:tRNA pseudouridine38-40 synthase